MMRSVAGGPVLSALLRVAIAAAFAAMALPAIADPVYFPGDHWERRAPAAAGFDPAALEEAIRYAQQNEAPWERDVFKQIQKDVANEPYPAILGETKERGGPAGMVVRHGYLVAQWGDVDHVDMSFSVAKSYLSTVAGLAVDAGLIADVNDRVADYVQDGGFDDSHNRKVTWHMLLNQTSEWEGTLWDKPDVADRRRGYDRKLQAPGTFWEYNDVRVNRLALALLRVYQRPLPEVLKEKVMDPIGASDTWVWHGYLWWLSRNRRGIFPGAPESSFFALGLGGNMIWIAPEYDLVVVTRWLDIPKLDGFITRISAALQAGTKN